MSKLTVTHVVTGFQSGKNFTV